MLRLIAIFVVLFTTCLQRAEAQYVSFDQPFKDTVVCLGKTVTLSFTTVGAFQPGNVFTAQLSDATGFFNTPIDIGSVAANTTDNITVTFPLGVSVGSKYRIRLVSTFPMTISPDNGADIRIEHIPNRPIITNNSPVCEHDTLIVDVTNAGTAQTDSLVWSGGIFTVPSNGPKTLTYNDAFIGLSGTYTIVRYSKTSKCASDTTQTSVWVQPLPPKPVASATPPIVCEGHAVQLNASTNPVAPGYNWTGPAGYSSGSKDPYIAKIPASGEGWYKVFSVENGCYSGKGDSVWVDVIPSPKLNITTNSPLCEGGVLQAAASDTGNISYTWKGPNSFQENDSALNIPATTAASGMYYVHTIRNGCSSVDSISLRVKPYPLPTVLNANTPVCEGDTLSVSTVNIAQPGIVTYQFYGPGGESMGSSAPIIPKVTKAGEGNYVLKADIEGCSRADSVFVSVKPTPVIATEKEFMGVALQPVQLKATSSMPGTSFQWTGPNGFNSSEQNPIITSVTERNKGTYTVTGNFDGCTSDTSTEVGVWYLTDYTLFEIHPNPNNGKFTLLGRVKKPQVVEIAIYHGGSGIVLYKDKIQSNGKLIEANITLHNHLAPGEYILKARADGESQGVKFIILH